MKILGLLLALSSFVAFASTSVASETETSAGTISYYHGMTTVTTAEGKQRKLLTSMTTRMMGADDRAGVFFIYRFVNNEVDFSRVLLVKRFGDTDDDQPSFYKVYVPSAEASLTNVDEHSVSSLQMQEGGWGHGHIYRTHHGYIKHSLYLNYLRTNGLRIDVNSAAKIREDGSQQVYAKTSLGTDADGLQEVWNTKLKLVFTTP